MAGIKDIIYVESKREVLKRSFIHVLDYIADI